MKFLSYGPYLIIIAAVLWALDGIIRRSLYTLPPITIVFFEHLIGALILLPFVLTKFRKEKITRRDLTLVGVVSLLSSLLGTLWFTTALLKVNFISFSVVYLLQKLQPIFAITAAVILLKEKLNPNFLKWAFLALISAYFVTFKDGLVNLNTGSGTVIAALFAIGAAFAWGSSTAISKMALSKNNPTYITGLRFIFTSFMALVGVYFLGQSNTLTSVNFSQLSRFAFIAVSTGMVALLIYYHGLKKTEAKISTLLELVYPLLAVAIDTYLFKTILAPSQYIAALVLLFSVYNITKLQKVPSIETAKA
ncbi:DMT family transporter [Candidatus Daviesbacteria bacterium]|nr:DMT family transporter [Candidatus Daviesbacteria bacterium]